MEKPLYILISGHNGSGKTTLANKLKNTLENKDYKVEIRSFSNSVKTAVKNILGISYEQLEKDKRTDKKYFGHTIREWLIAVGQGVKNKLNNTDIWAKIELSNLSSDLDIIIIDDFRFEEELKYIENKNFKYLVISTEKYYIISNGELLKNSNFSKMFDVINTVVKNFKTYKTKKQVFLPITVKLDKRDTVNVKKNYINISK